MVNRRSRRTGKKYKRTQKKYRRTQISSKKSKRRKKKRTRRVRKVIRKVGGSRQNVTRVSGLNPDVKGNQDIGRNTWGEAGSEDKIPEGIPPTRKEKWDKNLVIHPDKDLNSKLNFMIDATETLRGVPSCHEDCKDIDKCYWKKPGSIYGCGEFPDAKDPLGVSSKLSKVGLLTEPKDWKTYTNEKLDENGWTYCCK